MSIETPRHLPETEQASLFPLPGDGIRHHAQLFSEFTEAELQAVRQGNLDVEGDPMAHVLALNARPGLRVEHGSPQDEAKVAAYSAGVLACGAIVRRRQRLMERERGVPLPVPAFDAAESPIFDTNLRERVAQRVPASVRGTLLRGWEREVCARPLDYFAEPVSIAYLGLLKAAWKTQGFSFMMPEAGQRDVSTYVALGMSDTLATIAHQHNYVPQKHQVEAYFNPSIHFDDTAKHSSWYPKPNLDRYKSLPILGWTPREELHRLGTTYEAVGYRAHLKHDSYKGASKKEYVNLWWNAHVPAKAYVESVRKFDASVVLANAKEEDWVMRVGHKGSLKEYGLGRRAQLIVHGRDDELFMLEHPFYVDLDIADPHTKSVELCMLVQHGKIHQLCERSALSSDNLAQLEEAARRLLFPKALAGSSSGLRVARELYARGSAAFGAAGYALHALERRRHYRSDNRNHGWRYDWTAVTGFTELEE